MVKSPLALLAKGGCGDFHIKGIKPEKAVVEMGINILAHPGIKRTHGEFVLNKKEFNSTIVNPVRKSRSESDAVQ